MTVGSLSAVAGSTVTVPVSVAAAAGLERFELFISYPAGALTPLALEPTAAAAGFRFTVSQTKPGTLRIDATRTGRGGALAGELFGLKFALAPEARGRLPIDVDSARWVGAASGLQRLLAGSIQIKEAPAASSRPSIALGESARSFEIGKASSNAWLDQWLAPNGKNGKPNSWSVSVKSRTLH